MATLVPALLQAITPQTMESSNTAATPVLNPVPATLIGGPTLIISGINVDTVNLKVSYQYLAYQTYAAANLTQYIAIVQGQTGYISLPNLCSSYPNVTVAPSTLHVTTATIANNVIQFTINVTINYDSSIVGLYQVDTN